MKSDDVSRHNGGDIVKGIWRRGMSRENRECDPNDREVRWFPTAFRSKILERSYIESERRKLRQRTVPLSILWTMITVVYWLVFARFVDRKGHWSKHHIIYHSLNLVAVVSCVGVSLFQRSTTAWAEFSVLLLISIPSLCWALWSGYCSAVFHNVSSDMEDVQYKVWMDNVVHTFVMVLLVSFDQILQVRGCVAIVTHTLLLLCYIAFRIQGIITHYRVKTGDVAFVYTDILNIVVVAGLTIMVFSGRTIHEMRERIRFIRNRETRRKLSSMKQEQLRHHVKHGDATTAVERLVSMLSKSQLEVRELAFEISGYGDIRMIEADEILRQCKDLVINCDNLFSVKDLAGHTNRTVYDIATMYSTKASEFVLPHSARVPTGGEWLTTMDINTHFSAYGDLYLDTPKADFDSVRNALKDPFSYDTITVTQQPQGFQKFGYALITPYLESLDITPLRMYAYLGMIENHYNDNPYHNRGHGLGVALIGQVLTNVMGNVFHPAADERGILILSCLCHDVGHPGLNNAFYVSEGKTMGALYNDRAILENYHCFVTFRLAQLHQGSNIFRELRPAAYRRVRKDIIQLILATDMSAHFALISEWRLKRESGKEIRSAEDRINIYKMIIKLSDLSHALYDWELHTKWSLRISEEFYQQGDLEEQLGLPRSPLCNRAEHSRFAKNQCGFLEFVVLPLGTEVAALAGYMPSSSSMEFVSIKRDAYLDTPVEDPQSIVERIKSNLERWKQSTHLRWEMPPLPKIQSFDLPFMIIKQYMLAKLQPPEDPNRNVIRGLR
ncbi:phosphdiesterase [Gregarina niphandrodes]|uniref:Phosphodiesterase n=1 Tax=Gregarina niphandrodes TaxID=110365 RepID=A0A023B174_GRENI|nr:phosphdiesterase [Gregarina niphandrodes]EZG46758.1 phosphdiesterase [Gregarina niphandrodes]|eukprot:XP_011132267.1 phosphdiesterase [Gregarina niphandrodes]